jgi:hypothetical protein
VGLGLFFGLLRTFPTESKTGKERVKGSFGEPPADKRSGSNPPFNETNQLAVPPAKAAPLQVEAGAYPLNWLLAIGYFPGPPFLRRDVNLAGSGGHKGVGRNAAHQKDICPNC